MHADSAGGERHQSSYHKDRSDHGDLTDKPVVGPADHPKHEAAPDGEAQDKKDRGADEALRKRRKINPTVQGKPENYRHDDPADRVVDDGGRDDYLADG